ncbi:hypothetical protein W02_02450 [Nitrospira sp. KM1]|uniref:hypothetical protein n=1 Tax=Nitrospira sp. KM1 TaxID=1936990 RepID=UPI0013A73A3D|nr:hypothetical protein [Nitrospira sp. KM1]BCA53105.1 hypothetical protein W02_02450 [Nitrospira sp. KM1]
MAWKGRLNHMRTAVGMVLAVAILASAGCSSSIYGWQVRTHSMEPLPSFSQSVLAQEPVALFGGLAQPGLLGGEIGLEVLLSQILKKVAPHIKVIEPNQTLTTINRVGLSADYTRMRNDALQSNMLDRDLLNKLSAAVGARYVFQPRLTAFTQTMTDRWKFPALDFRVSQTRSGIMRLSLQLWDAETGDLIWFSIAEATMQSESLSQDPVYFEDMARVSLGSVIADFLNGKTASTYTPLNKILDQLIQVPVPEEKRTEGKPLTGSEQ